MASDTERLAPASPPAMSRGLHDRIVETNAQLCETLAAREHGGAARPGPEDARRTARGRDHLDGR